jgi:hypothetical protein
VLQDALDGGRGSVIDGKVTKQDVAHDLTILNGHQGHVHGSICPKAVHQCGFRSAV